MIAVSAFGADEIAEHTAIRRERIRVVPNGVDLLRATTEDVARARAAYSLADRPYVFWAGTFQPRKNVGTLLEAFARACANADLPHRLVLAGPEGWLVDEAPAARRLGDRVRLLGAVPRPDVLALFAGAELFVFPSRHEGFGIPVLEAMAQDTAVLCSDIPALREVAGPAARFVDPGDVDAWADAAERVARGRRGSCRPRDEGTHPRERVLVGALRRRDGSGLPRGALTGASGSQDLDAVVGDEHGVLELRGA